MKRKALILLTILAVVSLSACSNNPAPASDDGESKITVSMVSETAAEGTTESGGSESTSSFEPVSESTASASEESEVTIPPASETQAERAHDEPMESESPTAQPKQAQNEAPVTVQPQPTPEPQPAEPQPAEPQPTEPPAPSFDVSTYVAYAKSYGQGIGLALDGTAVSCWDDPITANTSCTYLERDIRDRLDWYLASGYTGFTVWSEDVGGGNYLIYIGYA
jgi:outer membrane biosynthesis protein TonB